MKINGVELPRLWWVPFLGICGLMLLGIGTISVIYTGGFATEAERARILAERDGATMEQLTQAITLNPEYAEGYVKRAKLALKTKEFASASADVDKALALSPGNQELLQLRAQIRQQEGPTTRH